MPALDPLLLIVLIAVAANTIVLAGVVLVPPLIRRRRANRRKARHVALATAVDGAVPHGGKVRDAVAPDGVPAATYDRVVRLVSWIVILGTSVYVAVSGLYQETQTAILVVLAIAGFIVLVVHDILPSGALGANKFVLEACLAITLVTLLIILTGQESSPFFFAYPLIVAGAALVVPPSVTVVMAGLASVDYVIGVAVDRNGVPLTGTGLATVAINIAAMLLLSFVASYVAREQRRSREVAIRLSTIDSLTGLFNRAHFFAAVEREIQRSSRTGRRFGLLMMDLDGLKAVNDRFGHFQGDQVLKAVSQVIRSGVRRIDTAARYGGDEFVVLLPETEPTGAYVLAEKIRQGVEELGVRGPGADIRTSLSIGAVSYPDDGRNADELLISADRAMYVSKRQGKNRVVGYVRPEAAVGGRADDSV